MRKTTSRQETDRDAFPVFVLPTVDKSCMCSFVNTGVVANYLCRTQNHSSTQCSVVIASVQYFAKHLWWVAFCFRGGGSCIVCIPSIFTLVSSKQVKGCKSACYDSNSQNALCFLCLIRRSASIIHEQGRCRRHEESYFKAFRCYPRLLRRNLFLRYWWEGCRIPRWYSFLSCQGGRTLHVLCSELLTAYSWCLKLYYGDLSSRPLLSSTPKQDTFRTAHEFLSTIFSFRALLPTAADGADEFDTLDFFGSISSLDPPSLSCNLQTLFSLRLAQSNSVELQRKNQALPAENNVVAPFHVRANTTAVLARGGGAA